MSEGDMEKHVLRHTLALQHYKTFRGHFFAANPHETIAIYFFAEKWPSSTAQNPLPRFCALRYPTETFSASQPQAHERVTSTRACCVNPSYCSTRVPGDISSTSEHHDKNEA